MNKISLLLNVILIAAVGYLYYEHYHYANEDLQTHANERAAAVNSFKIAYFELDSVENNYEYVQKVNDDLMKKDQTNAQQLNKLKNNYLNKLQEYQKKGSMITAQENSDYQQTLARMQDDYQQTEQQLSNEMQAEMGEKLQDVKNKIEDFLKGYCAQKGLAYVFGASSNDNFLYYKDSIRNITPDLIKGLNDQYKSTQ